MIDIDRLEKTHLSVIDDQLLREPFRRSNGRYLTR
jgi:hypothetical protein